RLRGKFVLSAAMRDVLPQFQAPGHRFSDDELTEIARQPGGGGRGNFQFNADFNRRKAQFWVDEGVAAVLDFGRGDGGTVFVQSPPGVSREPSGAPQPPQVTLAIEHYGRIYRTLEKKIPVTLQMD